MISSTVSSESAPRFRNSESSPSAKSAVNVSGETPSISAIRLRMLSRIDFDSHSKHPQLGQTPSPGGLENSIAASALQSGQRLGNPSGVRVDTFIYSRPTSTSGPLGATS